jgi:hypothetical protein
VPDDIEVVDVENIARQIISENPNHVEAVEKEEKAEIGKGILLKEAGLEK